MSLTKKRFKLFPIILGAVLIFYSVVFLMMIFWSVMTSFKDTIDYTLHPFSLPNEWMFENYIKVFRMIRVSVAYGATYRWVYLWEMLYNGFIYSLGCAVVSTLTPCIMAYLTAKYKFRLNKFIHTVVIIAMILPIVGSLPSEMQLVKALGFYNNMWGMFILKANFLGMYFLVFYGTFKSLSWEYAEAAFVDGASHFTVLVRVMLPLVRTTIFAVMLLQFIGFWNDYQIPMLYIPSRPTASYGLFQFSTLGEEGSGSVPMSLAASVVVMLPMVVLFIIFRDKFIGNLTMGGIKG